MDAPPSPPPPRDRRPGVSPTQVIALGIVVASIGWAVWLLRDTPANEEVELLAGTSLPSSELAIMEAAFDRAQLVDHRTDGGRVWVPRSRQSAYMRALVDAEALPQEFGGSLRRVLEKNSPWQSRAVQDDLLRVATQEELALVIRSMPGIERAAVLYDTESRHGFAGPASGGPVRTASVNVRMQPDAELDPARVQAIRVLVSASIAGLAPDRVAVTDLRSGRAYVGPLDAEAGRDAAVAADPALARRIAHETHLAGKLRQALAFVKGAAVDVAVEFGGPAAAAPPAPEPAAGRPGLGQKPAEANAPADLDSPAAAEAGMAVPPTGGGATGLPDSIVVSIAVPDSYFQAACRAAAERAGQPALEPFALEQQETERIRRHALSLLPSTRDPAARRVVVTTFPVAGSTPVRRDLRDRGRAAAAAGGALEDRRAATVNAIFAALASGRLEDVPRQAWLATTSICVGLLSALLWLLGGRRESTVPVPQPRIDWSAAADAAEGDRSGVRPVGRAAALVLVMLTSAADARAAGTEPTIAPEPAAVDTDPLATASLPVTAERLATRVPAALPLDDGPSPGTPAGAAGQSRGGDWRLLGAMAATFAALAAAAAVARRRGPTPLPPDVFEVLGSGPLGGQHSVRVVRFGPKTLLVAVSAGGCQTLAELADPQATACVAAACRGMHPPIRPVASASPRGTAGATAQAPPSRRGGEAT